MSYWRVIKTIYLKNLIMVLFNRKITFSREVQGSQTNKEISDVLFVRSFSSSKTSRLHLLNHIVILTMTKKITKHKMRYLKKKKNLYMHTIKEQINII